MSILIRRPFARRSILRGMLNGAAVGVALPFLDCFLNDSGTALAASGAPLPVRFATWFWGLGHSPGFGISDKGPEIELLNETQALAPYKASMNSFSGFNAPLDANFTGGGRVVTDADGRFTITTVKPGPYRAGLPETLSARIPVR